MDQLQKVCQAFVKRHFRHHHIETTDTGYAIYGEKGRWSRFGVYTVHLSVILLLVGGLIGSIFGFDGWVNIPEGESVSQIRLRSQERVLQLDFEIRCDDFDVSFYETGAPKEFRSSLTILEHSVRWWLGCCAPVLPEYDEGSSRLQADGWRNCGARNEL